MKQQLITKQSIDEKKQKDALNKRIELLKKEFRKRTYNSIGGLYTILNEIVRLRKYENKNYAPRSLEWEKDLNLTAMQIRYIFSYQYLCDYAKKKIEEGLLFDSTLCHFLRVSSLLREEQWQIKLIDRIIKGDIKVSQVSELKEEELKKFLLYKLEIREDDSYFLSATKTLRSMITRLKERKHLLKNSPFSDNLRNSIKELGELL